MLVIFLFLSSKFSLSIVQKKTRKLDFIVWHSSQHRVCSLFSLQLVFKFEKMSFIHKILRINAVRTLATRSVGLTTSRTAATSSPIVPKWTSSHNFGGHRYFQTSSCSTSAASREEVTVTFIRTTGERLEAKGKVGDNLVRMFPNSFERTLSTIGTPCYCTFTRPDLTLPCLTRLTCPYPFRVSPFP